MAARDALSQIVGAAPFHDGHGRSPAHSVRGGLCGEMCCKTNAISGRAAYALA